MRVVSVMFVAVGFLTTPVLGQVYNWQTGEVISGTGNIQPGPSTILDHWNTDTHNLRYADLSGARDLHWANFRFSWLDYARFSGANLTGTYFDAASLTHADLRGANLTYASFDGASLASADLTDANITNACFGFTTSSGLTKEQLYSTASYRAGCLQGVYLNFNNLAVCNLAGQKLYNSYFWGTTLTGANLSGADLAVADFSGAILTNANLSGAMVVAANLSGTTSTGFTKEQLYSTASYQAGDLYRIDLRHNDMTGWNFANQNVGDAYLCQATLTSANLSGASLVNTQFMSSELTDADLHGANLSGACFQEATLTGANLSGANATRAFFGAEILTNVNFSGANLTGADFREATLTGANMAGATVAGANLDSATLRGFTKEQLYSTGSYQRHDLHGILLPNNDLSGWNLADQNLTGAMFVGSALTNTNFSRSDMRGVELFDGQLAGAITTNAILPNGHINGLHLQAGETMTIRNYNGDTPITIDSGMTLAKDSVLDIVLGDDPSNGVFWGSTISLAGGFIPDLSGMLKLEFDPNTDLQFMVGRPFSLFNWNGLLAPGQEFSQVVSLPGYEWDLSNLYTTGEVMLISVPEPMTLCLVALGGVLIVRRRGV